MREIEELHRRYDD
jgi:hypothetical protein